MGGRVVVGVDGSDQAARALRWAIDEARLRGAWVEAVHAWDYPVVSVTGFPVPEADLVIPNASASAGSARLLAELDATVFKFRTVESVEYRLEGSCADFNEWLKFGGCEPRVRGTATD